MTAPVFRTLALFGCLALLIGCNGNDHDTKPKIPLKPLVWGDAEADLINGKATVARFNNPVNVEVAPDGTVYVADFDNSAIRVIAKTGIVSTLVKQANFVRPFAMTLAKDGNLYVQTDGNDTGQRNGTTGTVWRINTTTGLAEVVVRNVGRPRGLQALPDGRIAMSDLVHNVISVLNPATGDIQPVAGMADQAGFVNDNGTAARFSRPYGLALASDGALLVADQNNNCIRRVTLTGEVTTFAGTGTPGNQNDIVTGASFNLPEDVAIAGSTIYISDQSNHLIRRIDGNVVTTFAGSGSAGFKDGKGTAAEFFGLEGIAVNADGSILWMADGNGGTGALFNRVRRLATDEE